MQSRCNLNSQSYSTKIRSSAQLVHAEQDAHLCQSNLPVFGPYPYKLFLSKCLSNSILPKPLTLDSPSMTLGKFKSPTLTILLDLQLHVISWHICSSSCCWIFGGPRVYPQQGDDTLFISKIHPYFLAGQTISKVGLLPWRSPWAIKQHFILLLHPYPAYSTCTMEH